MIFTRIPAKVPHIHQSSGEGAICMRVAIRMSPISQFVCQSELTEFSQNSPSLPQNSVLSSETVVSKQSSTRSYICLGQQGGDPERIRTTLLPDMASTLNCQGQVSEEGMLHLVNPNLGSNSGTRIFEPRIFGAEFRGRNFWPFFPIKRAPSKLDPEEIHRLKFISKNSTQNSD